MAQGSTAHGMGDRARTAWFSIIGLMIVLIVLASSRPADAASDPYLEWWTIETPHFRVHYYRGLEPVAERVAAVAEGIYPQMAEALGWRTSETTEIVVTDNTDDANGSATSLPYNTIRLFTTAPDDLSPLGDYADQHLELVSHELTHILHLDDTSGLPAIVNAFLGKTISPNAVQPHWLLEGLAVLEESRHTSGGRNRSSVFDMYLRADVLDHNLATLSQLSNVTRRWPQGNLWYLYGSRFLTWIADVYGDNTMRAIATDYGQRILPFGINRSIRRATGRTYPELYEGWKKHLGDVYGAQLARIQARGIREGSRLTHHGQNVAHPRFCPAEAIRAAGHDPDERAAGRDPVGRVGPGTDRRQRLLYSRDDGHERSGFYRLDFDRSTPTDPAAQARSTADERLVVRTSGIQSASFAPDGGLVFGTIDVSNHVYAYDDLFALPAGAESPSGFEPERRRLTTGARATDPDVSPDGRSVVYTENHRGTTTLIIAKRSADGSLSEPRALVGSARFEQAYTPRFSPDGGTVAYSAWTYGGYRDIRLVSVATGEFREVFHDRALDWQPSFSPDGKTVFFASDRANAIPNIFAVDLADGKVSQVTNVRTGAFFPEVSPDGKTLVYVGYTSAGFDLYTMPIDRTRWLEPPIYDDPRPTPPPLAPAKILDRHRYNPLATLRPRSYDFAYGPGNYGTAVRVSTLGSDVVGHHAISASVLVDGGVGIQGAVGYAYRRLPFDFGASVYRLLNPRQGFRYGDQQPMLLEEQLGLASGLSYGIASAFDSQSFSFGYSINRNTIDLPLDANVDPQSLLPLRPAQGQIAALQLGWSYSNAEGFLHSVSAERGLTASVGVSSAMRAIGSDYSLYSFAYTATGYLPMPWARHHVLALRATAAISAGDYPNRGLYYTGGFLSRPIINPATTDPNGLLIGQGSFVLRGYAPLAFSGSQYHLYGAEYRLPLVTVDRGPSTLPLYLQRLDGALFADYGGAFETLDTKDMLSQFHLGVGAELWAEVLIGYAANAILRFGYANGLGDAAAIPGGRWYFALSAPF